MWDIDWQELQRQMQQMQGSGSPATGMSVSEPPSLGGAALSPFAPTTPGTPTTATPQMPPAGSASSAADQAKINARKTAEDIGKQWGKNLQQTSPFAPTGAGNKNQQQVQPGQNAGPGMAQQGMQAIMAQIGQRSAGEGAAAKMDPKRRAIFG
jgi:hypothetical protein